MSDQIRLAANTLFPDDGARARDIKFFDAGMSGVTAQQLAEQVNRAEAAIRHGRVQEVDDVEDYLTS